MAGPRDEKVREEITKLVTLLSEVSKKSELLDNSLLELLGDKVREFDTNVTFIAVAAGISLPPPVGR